MSQNYQWLSSQECHKQLNMWLWFQFGWITLVAILLRATKIQLLKIACGFSLRTWPHAMFEYTKNDRFKFPAKCPPRGFCSGYLWHISFRSATLCVIASVSGQRRTGLQLNHCKLQATRGRWFTNVFCELISKMFFLTLKVHFCKVNPCRIEDFSKYYWIPISNNDNW